MKEINFPRDTIAVGECVAVVAKLGSGHTNAGDAILMEAEGDGSSLEGARDRAARLRGVIRWQIVRLVPTSHGNQLLLKDLVRMQK